MTDLDRDPAPISEAARRQAQALLATRLDARPRPLLLPARGSSAPRWTIRLALGAASLLMVSGAWAWVHRMRPPVPLPVIVKTVPRLAHAVVVVAPIAPSVAVRASVPHTRKRPQPTPPLTATAKVPPDQVRFDEEPMGDVIFGRAPRPQPPLFTVEEYKARGVLVH
jgi:hypothetical protein